MPLLQEYNQFQVKQLTKLIEVTRTDLKKEDRQKVMNMITIDAHSRDMVESIAESGIDRCTLAHFAPIAYRVQICYLRQHVPHWIWLHLRGVLGIPDKQPLRFDCNHGTHPHGKH